MLKILITNKRRSADIKIKIPRKYGLVKGDR